MLRALDDKLYDFITLDRLNEAILKNEILLFYQPKMKINYINKNYEVQGIEALIRWFDSKLGYIEPNKIISIAKKKGIIVHLGKWIFDRAFKDMKSIKEKSNGNIKLVLNISLEELKNSSFIKNLIEISLVNNFLLSNLELDIKDNVDSKLAESLKLVFTKLKSLGVSIVLDDYGSYHECLEFVTNNDVDGIKLDSYIIDTSEKDTTLKMIVYNLHRLGKKVIAEGVETKEQFEIVKYYGCDEAQGYFLCEPLKLEEIIEIL
ncbi:EAL domain-containing protein [Clostridium tarantellae]|uniref:EAL domain-containing protein n=1 Tax=Clostridium tarantellae TaxID=39493 RepID=A0A6I1MX05_9CLOT|nr:EAL domain-containing protein [Clostridium tarantellae]MPQ44689.1 EAL domain-containing protein [Clostridium tarantellae]